MAKKANVASEYTINVIDPQTSSSTGPRAWRDFSEFHVPISQLLEKP